MCNGTVGDVALLAIQNVALAVRRRYRRGLNVAGVGARFRFSQGKGGQLSARAKRRQPATLLLLRAEQQECRDADALMGVDKNRGRGTAAANSLQDPAVAQLRETGAAIFLGRRHAQDTE